MGDLSLSLSLSYSLPLLYLWPTTSLTSLLLSSCIFVCHCLSSTFNSLCGLQSLKYIVSRCAPPFSFTKRSRPIRHACPTSIAFSNTFPEAPLQSRVHHQPYEQYTGLFSVYRSYSSSDRAPFPLTYFTLTCWPLCVTINTQE